MYNTQYRTCYFPMLYLNISGIYRFYQEIICLELYTDLEFYRSKGLNKISLKKLLLSIKPFHRYELNFTEFTEFQGIY